MEKEIKMVTITDDEGNNIELEVLEEFEHKGKKYVLLLEESDCTCGDECDCEEGECDDRIYIYEVQKDEEDNDKYIEITDEKVMEELVKTAEKLLYKEDK
jgi:uncharacterized protein YrzB (UPF0473 family)